VGRALLARPASNGTSASLRSAALRWVRRPAERPDPRRRRGW